MIRRDVTVVLPLPADDVFAAFTDPSNLPHWARAEAPRAASDGWWTFDTPAGAAAIRFHTDRARGVADHEYRDRKRTWRVPARVVAIDGGSTLTLTLERPAGMDDASFERQVAAVEAELASFSAWLERRR